MLVEHRYKTNLPAYDSLPPPATLKKQLPLQQHLADLVQSHRRTIQEILARQDHRLFIVVGPCSVHDLTAAWEYAKRLKGLAEEVSDTMVVVMRAYFEKPRTAIGWKGLINDPHLDGSCRIQEGLVRARQFLLQLAELDLPAGIEVLDPITPQYLSDLTAWSAIGARTTESQVHREIASGLPTPVGFKNGTDGNIEVAMNALRSTSRPHHFIGVNELGHCAVVRTGGNPYGHIVLRGGYRPNYDSDNIALCERTLRERGLQQNIVVDCSHGNASKGPGMQPLVMARCIDQIGEGNTSIVGLMVESNLKWGNQEIPQDLGRLRYGVSVTDSCVDWETTEKMLRNADRRLRDICPYRILRQTMAFGAFASQDTGLACE